MKQLFAIFITQLIAFGLFAQDKNRVEDFRGIVWGTPKAEAMRDGEPIQFVKVKSTLEPNTYYINDDQMSIGSVKLNNVHYSFSSDEERFDKVSLMGDRSFINDMIFILNYKFGKSQDEPTEVDGVKYRQWVVQDVTFTLSEYEARDFVLKIESDWKAAEKYRKNTKVEDF